MPVGAQRPVSAPPSRPLGHVSRAASEPSSPSTGTGLPPWFLQSKRRPDALSVAPDKHYASMSQHLGSRQKRGQLVRGNFGAIEEPQQSRQHGCDFQPMLLQALEADLFEEFHSCTDRLASQISRDLGEKVDAMRQETAGSLQLLKADLKSLGDVVRSTDSAASSYEPHSIKREHGTDAGMSAVLAQVQAGSLAVQDSINQMHSESLDEIRRLEAIDLTPLLVALGEMSQRHERSMETIKTVLSGFEAAHSTGSHDYHEPDIVDDLQKKVETNFAEILQALESHSTSSLKGLEEIQRGESQRNIKQDSLLHIVDELQRKVDMDFSDVLHAMEANSAAALSILGDIQQCIKQDIPKAAPAEACGSVSVPPTKPYQEEPQKITSFSEENLLSKGIADQKLLMVELKKISSLLDGFMDMSRDQFDLGPVLDAIAKLDPRPAEVNFDSVFRTITEISGSIAAAQAQLSQAGKLTTENDFMDLRQVVMANLHDLGLNGERLREKIDTLEERLLSRIVSNHKVAMLELQKYHETLQSLSVDGLPGQKDT